MNPEVTVLIPWRPSPSRLKPYECVRRWWAEFFPDWPVITADSETDIFSLSQARNNACRQAETDIVVFCDADTIPPLEGIKAAVQNPVGITWPHKMWRLIPPEYAEKPWHTFDSAPALSEYPNGLGGVMICTRDEYWRLGGQPEEFCGWGHEDRAFHCVVNTLSTFHQIGGIAYSIEHNQRLRVADSPDWHRDSRRNQEIVKPYEIANGDPALMKLLLEIRYEPRDRHGDWRHRAGLNEIDEARRKLFGHKPHPEMPSAKSDWKQRWISTENDPLVGRFKG